MSVDSQSKLESFAQSLAVGFFSSVLGVYVSVKVMENDIDYLKKSTEQFQPVMMEISAMSQWMKDEQNFKERQLVLNDRIDSRLRELEKNAD